MFNYPAGVFTDLYYFYEIIVKLFANNYLNLLI
jgi:hypothetical protein